MLGSVHSECGSSAGEMVVDCVSRCKADQIVMGTRGLGLIRRTILGRFVNMHALEFSTLCVGYNMYFHFHIYESKIILSSANNLF